MKSLLKSLILLIITSVAIAQSPVATYRFQNNYLSDQVTAPPLVLTDPSLTSGFTTSTVFGVPRTVLAFRGTNTPSNQSGLTLATSGLLPPTNYAVEMVLEFNERDNGWRRLIDVENRQSDSGFYVDPGNHLDIYPVLGSSNSFVAGNYYHVVLSVQNDITGAQVKAYLNGVFQFNSSTTLMNINQTDNPGLLMNFFLDNVVAGGQGEWSSGQVALIRCYNTPLTDAQAAALAANPFGNGVIFTGTVKLQGWVGNTLPTVDVSVNGGANQTLTLSKTSTNTGTFSVQVPSGAINTIRVKPNTFLSQAKTIASNVYSATFDNGGSGLIPGDSNNNNNIDDSDLLAVINNFLSSPPTGNADYNGDGIVEDTDLLDDINNFLSSGN